MHAPRLAESPALDALSTPLPMPSAEPPIDGPVDLARVVRTWWPLAASWLLMSAELPLIVAVVARLENPEINLAAFGGVVFPLALIIESPVIMLLAASTALCRDAAAYARIRSYMMRAGAALTVLHLVVALTPLYDVVVRGLIGAPEALVEPARLGLLLMLPWTWAIGYRRFQQGVLIRFGHSRAVGLGTLARLAADALVLGVGYAIGDLPGIAVGATAISAGVVTEAVVSGWLVRPVRNGPLADRPLGEPVLLGPFMTFYIPLVLTSLVALLAQPIGSAAMSRMALPVASLAAWPAIAGLSFILRSSGMAFNEVMVALLDEPGAGPALKRFAILLGTATTAIGVLLVATPAADFWFRHVSALPPDLTDLARSGAWLIVPLAALVVIQSRYQGALVHGRRTRAITESVVLGLGVNGALLVTAVTAMRHPTLSVALGDAAVRLRLAAPGAGTIPGLHVALWAMLASNAVQAAWLWWRGRGVLAGIEAGG